MKFCPVVPEICRGQVHGAWKERRITRIRIVISGKSMRVRPESVTHLVVKLFNVKSKFDIDVVALMPIYIE